MLIWWWPSSVYGIEIGGSWIVFALDEICCLSLTCSIFSTLPPLVVTFKWIGTFLVWVFFLENSARYLSVALPSVVASGCSFSGSLEIWILTCCFSAYFCCKTWSSSIFLSCSFIFWSSISLSFLIFSWRRTSVFYFSISNYFYNSNFSLCIFSYLNLLFVSSYCLFSWAADTISFSADYETSFSICFFSNSCSIFFFSSFCLFSSDSVDFLASLSFWNFISISVRLSFSLLS